MTRVASLLVVLLVSVAFQAQAGVVMYTDRTGFNSLGAIAYNSNFDDFGSGFSYPGTPWTRGDVTYTSTRNLIVGTGTGYAPIRNVIVNDYWTPLTGTLAGGYDMFGFDIGWLGFASVMDVLVVTNLGSYAFNDLVVPPVSSSMTFLGYVSGSGEYITSFSISSPGLGYAPAITDVAVGHTGAGAIPEPSTVALAAGGLLALAALRRKLR